MNTDKRDQTESAFYAGGIRAGTLGAILGSFVFGFVAGVLVLRAMQGGVETVSTIELLSFFLIAGLSIFAMALSSIAIVLSRSVERMIVQKVEEIHVLQSALEERTGAALERMESSVRRTGEELSDAVYANFEMLAEELQERFCQGNPEALDDISGLVPVAEPDVQEAPVMEMITEEPVLEVPVSKAVDDEEREKVDKKYGEFKDIVLLGVANYPGVISRKVGEGQYRTEGDELVDGVFLIQNEKVAVCTFCTNTAILDRFMGETNDSFNGFLRALVTEIKSGHFTRVLLVFDGQLTNASPYAKALNGLSRKTDSETFSCFELFEGTPDIVIPELTERVSQLMEETAVGSPDAAPEISYRRQASA